MKQTNKPRLPIAVQDRQTALISRPSPGCKEKDSAGCCTCKTNTRKRCVERTCLCVCFPEGGCVPMSNTLLFASMCLSFLHTSSISCHALFFFYKKNVFAMTCVFTFFFFTPDCSLFLCLFCFIVWGCCVCSYVDLFFLVFSLPQVSPITLNTS